MFFRDRQDAGEQLAAHMKDRKFRNPVVLAIPRGGVVTGAALARELGAEFDVILSRKLRSPTAPEVAIGAVSETGDVYLNERFSAGDAAKLEEYLSVEHRNQVDEIARRNRLLRQVRPRIAVEGRSVIVTDD